MFSETSVNYYRLHSVTPQKTGLIIVTIVTISNLTFCVFFVSRLFNLRSRFASHVNTQQEVKVDLLFDLGDGGNAFLLNVGDILTDYMTSCARRQYWAYLLHKFE
jgi:hypothetical protein